MAKLYIIKSLIKEKLKKIDIIIEDWKIEKIMNQIKFLKRYKTKLIKPTNKIKERINSKTTL